MSEFKDVMVSHLRLAILRLLQECPGYAANCSVVHSSVQALGLRVTRDQVRGELAWLDQQRLVTTMDVGSGLTVATLTDRGSDVAKGDSVFPGVQRPSPGSGI